MDKTQNALAGMKDRFQAVIESFAGRGGDIGFLGGLFDENRDRLEDEIFVACCRVLDESVIDPYGLYGDGFFSDGLSLGRALSGQVLNYSCGKITKEEALDGIRDIIVEAHEYQSDPENIEEGENEAP